MAESVLVTGGRVRVIGLMMSPHLNDFEGVLGSFDPESGRWEVELEVASARDWKKLRPENLELVRPDAGAPIDPDFSGPACQPPSFPGDVEANAAEVRRQLADAAKAGELRRQLADEANAANAANAATAAEVRRQLEVMGVKPMKEEGREELEALGVDTAEFEKEVLQMRKEEVGEADLPEEIRQAGDIPMHLSDDFDVEVEQQQCEHLDALLKSLAEQGLVSRAHASAREAVLGLPSLLNEYQALVQQPSWRAERPDLLESASNAIAFLLAADNDRDLQDELPLGEEVLELLAAVVALRAVLVPASEVKES